MKGEATLIISKEQMREIAQYWWDSHTQIRLASNVVKVEANKTDGFVIEFTEPEDKDE